MTALAEHRGRVWRWGLQGPAALWLLATDCLIQVPVTWRQSQDRRRPFLKANSTTVSASWWKGRALFRAFRNREMTGRIPRAIRRCPQETHTRVHWQPRGVLVSLTVWHWLSPRQPSPSARTYLADAADGTPVHLLFLFLSFAPPPPPLLPTNLPPQRNCLTSLLLSFLPYYVIADAFSSSNHLSFKTGLNRDFPGGPGV